jgi:HEAT repeat protein
LERARVVFVGAQKAQVTFKRKWLAAFGVPLFIGLLVLLVFQTDSGQPVYEGRTFDQWFSQYPYPAQPQNVSRASKAMVALGPEAVPYLDRKLRTRETYRRKFYMRLYRMLPRWISQSIPEVHPAIYVRAKAASILQILGTDAEAAAPALLEALDDESTDVRQHAFGAFLPGGITPPAEEIMPRLIKALDGTQHERAKAAAIISKYPVAGRAAIPKLTRLLSDRLPGARHNALVALASIGLPEDFDLELIVEVLKQGHPFERGYAARALATSANSKRTVPLLIEALDDAEVRQIAVECLGQLGPKAKSAVPSLAQIVANSNAWIWPSFAGQTNTVQGANRTVRLAAAKSIWQITADATLARRICLEELAFYRENLVASPSVTTALMLLAETEPGVEELRPVIERFLQATDFQLQCAAAMALWKLDGRSDLALRFGMEALGRSPLQDQWLGISMLLQLGSNNVAMRSMLRQAANSSDGIQAINATRLLRQIRDASKEDPLKTNTRRLR